VLFTDSDLIDYLLLLTFLYDMAKQNKRSKKPDMGPQDLQNLPGSSLGVADTQAPGRNKQSKSESCSIPKAYPYRVLGSPKNNKSIDYI